MTLRSLPSLRLLAVALVAEATLSQAEAEPTAAATDLARMTVDTAKFPLAVCNDGSAASYYINRDIHSVGSAAPSHWIVLLEGGGLCMSNQSCAGDDGYIQQLRHCIWRRISHVFSARCPLHAPCGVVYLAPTLVGC